MRPVGETVASSREDRERTYKAVDAARDEMLADAVPALRRVYGYVRKAQTKDGRFNDNAIYEFYKAIETIEKAVGGRGKGRQKRTGQVLGVAKELEAVHSSALRSRSQCCCGRTR